jgi:quercetin dioxygenase-like cupin family protein
MNPGDDIVDEVALQERVLSELGAAIAPVELAPARRDALKARVLARVAPAPAGTTTWRVSDSGWFSPVPNVEMKLLRRIEAEGTQELLVRMGPGCVVPEHSHRKEEQMVILEGEVRVGEHLLRAGDTHVAPPGSWHPALTTERGVLMLLRIEDPMPA